MNILKKLYKLKLLHEIKAQLLHSPVGKKLDGDIAVCMSGRQQRVEGHILNCELKVSPWIFYLFQQSK